MAYYAGIEAGGTKFNCIVASSPDDIRAEIRIPTTTPQETIGAVIDFYRNFENTSGNRLVSAGIASFGPVDLRKASPMYGYITTTPKPGWADTDLVGKICSALDIPAAFDTDVNGAAVGEGAWGAGKGLTDFIYITIGTGIGGGAIINGKTTQGMVHPEIGHMLLPHDPVMDPYKGYCPFHGDCFEGLATGPAMRDRWGQPAETLPQDHPAWELEANYIALALHTLVCSFSPQRIILGGGVMQQSHLFTLIRKRLLKSLNGYVRSPILDDIDHYVVAPGLGTRSGVLGALAMAQQIA